ncbi:hypothetical protein [Lacimicrobium alkaliphilum]|uniref:Uncharacterized protein n=1 Tax=Lacimicrobium alkaliphilum TaxID=1526571 RepID=A0ABQ1RFN1_9ALTE|nr:hypothetical protein [Lacimicrobium alkaliphilum]GGD68939.1 hypothetical protein GCM10011357_25020 [Lacimicrobium alkaliphilum]
MAHHPEIPIDTYVKMSRNDLSDLWFDAYGWIACYFAQLEGLSYALIDLLCDAQDKVRFKKLPYQKRMDQARTMICAHFKAQGQMALADEWDAFLCEAKAAAPLRNKILHNPLSINLALGDPLNNPDAGIILTHQPGQPVLKLGAVQEFARSMLELNNRMQDLLLRGQLIPQQSGNNIA